MEEINIKRADIGDCRDCKKSPHDVKFKGIFNKFGTHLKSDCGWWLRIDHHHDYRMEGVFREPDTVGDLLCPPCLDLHNERMREFF